jgi:lipopolysaccharide export system permease protein
MMVKPDNRLIKEYYNRFAFPFLNLILGLVGISFGIVSPRSPRFTGFILGIGTIFTYYLFYTLSDKLVKSEVMDPILSAWLPNTIFCLVLASVWILKRFHIIEGGV